MFPQDSADRRALEAAQRHQRDVELEAALNKVCGVSLSLNRFFLGKDSCSSPDSAAMVTANPPIA